MSTEHHVSLVPTRAIIPSPSNTGLLIRLEQQVTRFVRIRTRRTQLSLLLVLKFKNQRFKQHHDHDSNNRSSDHRHSHRHLRHGPRARPSFSKPSSRIPPSSINGHSQSPSRVSTFRQVTSISQSDSSILPDNEATRASSRTINNSGIFMHYVPTTQPLTRVADTVLHRTSSVVSSPDVATPLTPPSTSI